MVSRALHSGKQFIGNFDSSDTCLGQCRCINERPAEIDQVIPECFGPQDNGPMTSNGLSKCMHTCKTGGLQSKMLDKAFSPGSYYASGMCLIYHEVCLVMLAENSDIRQGCLVPVHGKNAFRNNKFVTRSRLQFFFQVTEIIVAK